ncbi:MAG: YceI family protein [Salinimicrobium sp.]
MKKRILNLVIIAGLAASSVACKNDKQNEVKAEDAREVTAGTEEAVTFEIDTTASTISWRGTKPTGEHVGTIDVQDGKIMATSENITGGKVTINMNSIAVTDEGMDEEYRTKLENHLKGTVEGKKTDFFNVEQFPTANFEITGLSEKEGKKMLQGNLTIKDETKHIEFPVTTNIEDDMLSIESETFTIDRTDWGVNYGSKTVFDDLGDKFISDDMELTINVKAKRS